MRAIVGSFLVAAAVGCSTPSIGCAQGRTRKADGTCVPGETAGQDAPVASDAGSIAKWVDAGAADAHPDSGVVLALADAGGAARPDGGSGTDSGDGGWEVVHRENFESLAMPSPSWQPDTFPDDGPFSDNGLFFQKLGIQPPTAFRTSAGFGDAGWLTAESYTRTSSTPFSSLASVQPDPDGSANHVLRIASPAHTDATLVRSSQPLPARYRISLKVGFADFGDGKPGLNGYTGGETAEPWLDESAIGQNGFYWLTILDSMPRPHNNTWIHHHRKVVIDSDNNYPPWMEVFDGQSFITSGEHPIMMFAIDGRGQGTERTGKPFLSYSGGSWQPSGAIRAVDAYLPKTWYQVTIERDANVFTMSISGRFRYGGQTTYRASIDAKANCVWHFNQESPSDAAACVDSSSYPSLGPGYPLWPEGQSWPDYFMFGDPHENFYEGSVYYDDVTLEVPR